MLIPPSGFDLSKERELARELFETTDTFLLDCDGVIWKGSEAIQGAKEFISLAQKKNKNVYFLTNNSVRSREQFTQRLKSFGIETTKDKIISAAYTAALYIKNVLKFPEDKKVYYIGMDGIKIELDLLGIKNAGAEDNGAFFDSTKDLNELTHDPTVGAVLVGLDLRFNYVKLAKAHLYLSSNKDVSFIATNEDATLPSTKYDFPGAGSVIASLKASLKREPIVVGKPSRILFDLIKGILDIENSNICMVGDRIETDIKFGAENFIRTVLVFTGVNTIQDMNASAIKPTYYSNSIADLIV